jgi:hypothetical protein
MATDSLLPCLLFLPESVNDCNKASNSKRSIALHAIITASCIFRRTAQLSAVCGAL